MQVEVTAGQNARLKQIFWDNFKEAPENSIWQVNKPKVNFDVDQISKLFQVPFLLWTFTLVVVSCTPIATSNDR